MHKTLLIFIIISCYLAIFVYCSGPAVCELPFVKGLCRGYFRRYYFDSSSGQCKSFIYGGCGGKEKWIYIWNKWKNFEFILGNENNFQTEDECIEQCGSSSSPDE